MADVYDFFHVDAFASGPFTGNPAAVCLLDAAAPKSWMQRLAAEMNLSETAFVVQRCDGDFDLRWCTPTVEVPLCGHATLASAHAVWESGRAGERDPIRFHTLSGVLGARRVATGVEIDLPAMTLAEAGMPGPAAAALGLDEVSALRTGDRAGGDHDWLIELDDERAVRAVRPDFAALAAADPHAGFIVTGRSLTDGIDFVSRYFAPAWGVDEDPVTGAAHCALAPHWCGQLGRQPLVGYQASDRGGRVGVRCAAGRALLTGGAVTVVSGTIRSSDR